MTVGHFFVCCCDCGVIWCPRVVHSLALDVGMQALAATGGKSTLTATEWILGQMESRNSSMPKHQPHQVWL